jgi:ABC-2 type transport system permease protein
MGKRFSLTRVFAMVMRYYYLLSSSWPRIADLIYWPFVQMITWGFLQTYLAQPLPNASLPGPGMTSLAGPGMTSLAGPGMTSLAGPALAAAGTLIGSMMLWDILFRGQLGFSLSFIEEMWSRNIANLLMSPLRPLELVAALMIMSLIRLAIGVLPVSLLALWFFGFNLWSLGFALIAFFINLILTSWSIGLVVSGLLLRHGLGAEGLVWTILFLMLPLACVYYPVAVLPAWLQPLAWALPPTYVFEGMRGVLIDKVFHGDLMLEAFALNGLYFVASVIAFLRLLESARTQGSLLQMGE